MTSPNANEFRLVAKCMNGGIAGVIGVTCVFPIDLVKTRLQNQSNTNRMYNSMFDCFRKTLTREGFRGMYSGSAVNILLITPEKAIKLASNDYFRHLLTDQKGNLPLHYEVVAGGAAGFCQIVITTPMELLKIQLQSAGATSAAASPATGPAGVVTAERLTATKVALNLLREKGILGLYKGTLATMLRDVTFSVIYFPLFANLNKLGPKRESGETVFWASFLSGCTAGSVAAFSVNPFDVVKTRLQVLNKSSKDPTYNGIVDAFRKTYTNEGLKAFFKGAGCRMVVIAPLFGIAQSIYYLGVAEFALSQL